MGLADSNPSKRFQFPWQRYTWVHRLHIKVPLESLTNPSWRPEGYDTRESYNRLDDGQPWRWPKRRQFFSADHAYRRAYLLERWGAEVRVESRRVEWTEDE